MVLVLCVYKHTRRREVCNPCEIEKSNKREKKRALPLAKVYLCPTGMRLNRVRQLKMGLGSSLVPVSACALLLLCFFTTGNNAAAASASGLKLNYYSKSCPRAEEIIREQVRSHYEEHGNTAVSWLRALFHDCAVKSCDASLLLETDAARGLVSEQSATRSFGMRNFKYIDDIKSALERACPGTVSCADLLAIAARDGVAMLGCPAGIPMRMGRRDATESYYGEVERYLPTHNDTVSAVLSRFAAMGVDAEGVVALLGAHSVGRVHCFNLVGRLYPAVDGAIEPAYGAYLRERCPTADAREDTRDVAYARNDRNTPMVIDNMYHKNLLKGRGLLLVDQRLATDPRTAPFVRKMAADNGYFHDRFAAALVKMSENAPLTGDKGEVRKDCKFVNS